MSYQTILENRKMDTLNKFVEGYNKNYLDYVLKEESVKTWLSDLDDLLVYSENILTSIKKFNKVVNKATDSENNDFLIRLRELFKSYSDLYIQFLNSPPHQSNLTNNPYAQMVDKYFISFRNVVMSTIKSNCMKVLSEHEMILSKMSEESNKNLKMLLNNSLLSLKKKMSDMMIKFTETPESRVSNLLGETVLEFSLLNCLIDMESFDTSYNSYQAEDNASRIATNFSLIDDYLSKSVEKGDSEYTLGIFLIMYKMSGNLNYLVKYGEPV